MASRSGVSGYRCAMPILQFLVPQGSRGRWWVLSGYLRQSAAPECEIRHASNLRFGIAFVTICRNTIYFSTKRGAHMAGDCSFYDERLKKQIWGSFITDGKALYVLSEYGTKRASYKDLG